MKCPECGDVLIRALWQTEGDWMVVWLCECEPTDEEIEEAEAVDKWVEKELERMG